MGFTQSNCKNRTDQIRLLFQKYIKLTGMAPPLTDKKKKGEIACFDR